MESIDKYYERMENMCLGRNDIIGNAKEYLTKSIIEPYAWENAVNDELKLRLFEGYIQNKTEINYLIYLIDDEIENDDGGGGKLEEFKSKLIKLYKPNYKLNWRMIISEAIKTSSMDTVLTMLKIVIDFKDYFN